MRSQKLSIKHSGRGDISLTMLPSHCIIKEHNKGRRIAYFSINLVVMPWVAFQSRSFFVLNCESHSHNNGKGDICPLSNAADDFFVLILVLRKQPTLVDKVSTETFCVFFSCEENRRNFRFERLRINIFGCFWASGRQRRMVQLVKRGYVRRR